MKCPLVVHFQVPDNRLNKKMVQLSDGFWVIQGILDQWLGKLWLNYLEICSCMLTISNRPLNY